MSRWKIAAVQMDCAFADKSRNLNTIRARLREAAANGAELVVFPECALTGYCFDSLEAAACSSLPCHIGRILEFIHLCSQLRVTGIVGFLENQSDRHGQLLVWNSALAAMPDGR